MRFIPALALLLLPVCLASCNPGPESGKTPEPSAATAATDGAKPQELDWDSLIPADWQPDTLMEKYDVNQLSDDDPRAKELMDKLRRLWAEAPVVPALDGKLVRLPGFAVPVESEGERISSLLLVPYYGACIHVPPPPANQTVFVRLPEELDYRGEMFDTVWVTGTLKVTPTTSDLADAGYRIDATAIAPYEGSVEPQ